MNETNEIQIIGVLSKGYGIMPKMIALDENLSIESKAIYSFLTSFSGVGQGVFPSIETILHYLKISKNRFYKYRQELLENGYITIKPRYDEKHKRKSNLYILNMEKLNPCIQNEYLENEYLENEYLENEDTNINNNNINNNNIINIKNNNDNNSGGDFTILKYAEERNFILSAIQMQLLLEEVVKYSLAEVKKALDISDDNGKHSYAYFKAVLEKRRSEGESNGDRNSRGSTSTTTKSSDGNKQYNIKIENTELTDEDRARAERELI
jgi:DNA replication protein DnaD